MKLTAISIFPEYFAPLDLSLIGKAQKDGLVTFTTVNLRDFTHDNHHTVDDTPYGGGAGMVMKPEPWGEAIDATLDSSDDCDLIVLTPAGKRFDQRMAERFTHSRQIIFACGRYEGIDARVAEFYRSQPRVRVHEISIGDYVLNGGEVAAIVMIEAIVRLLPGVLGNPESLLEESHNQSGEVEYPSFTKPAQWRGLNVPEVLLSGNHGEIARWRREEAERRSQSVD
jgi:tRNA (guanine37-N1)-methyltransferase